MIISSKIEMTKYDRILILIIFSQIFGLFGGVFQVTRLLALASIPLLITSLRDCKMTKDMKIAGFLFILFITIGLLSVFYSINQENSLKEALYMSINCLLFFEIIFFYKKANKPLYSLCLGWLFFVLSTLTLSFYEIQYDYHLELSYYQSDTLIGGLGNLKRFASVTFGNYNLYNFNLVLALPFVLSLLFNSNNKKEKLISFFALISIFFIILTNASRGALLSSIIMLFIFVLAFYRNNVFFLKKFLVTFLLILSSVFFWLFYLDNFDYLAFRLSNAGFEDQGRMDLVRIGIDMLLNSNFVGIGAGNFSDNVRMNYNSYLEAPHNIFIEIISQYGLIVFIFFIILLFRIYKKIVNANLISKTLLISTLLTFPITFVINSNYINHVYVWIYLASLFVIFKDKIVYD